MDFNKIKISDLGEVITGRTPPTKNEDYYGKKYPFITPTDINESKRYIETERYLSELGYEYQKKVLLPPDSTCLVCIGATIGKICLTKEPSFTNQQINSIIPDIEKYDPKFIYYLLSTKGEEIKQIAGGAATPIVNKSSFSNFKIKIPKLDDQKRIASTLSAFDDLIENNSRRIEILEEMARLIYREWFVHFRFPGHEDVNMVDSELGKIPEGWEVRTVEEFGTVITGSTPSKKKDSFYGGDIPFIKIPDMRGNIFCLETRDKLSIEGANSQKNRELPENSISVSCIGSIGIVSITTETSHTNQQINSVVPIRDSLREYLFFSLSDLRELIQQFGAVGATMPNLSKGKFKSLKLVNPDEQ
jgi:type I restriction enzyme S subunit